MSTAAQNNPEAKRGRHGESFTLIDPYASPLELPAGRRFWIRQFVLGLGVEIAGVMTFVQLV
jgi:hypothetical protein